MENLWWVGTLKVSVLVAFSSLFSGILVWLWRSPQMEKQRFIPLEEDDTACQM